MPSNRIPVINRPLIRRPGGIIRDGRNLPVLNPGGTEDSAAGDSWSGAPPPTGFDDITAAETRRDYVEKITEVGQVLVWMRDRQTHGVIRADAQRVRAELAAWDSKVFKGLWRYARTLVSLQARLYMEQIFFEMGGPWLDLITGFNPVDKKPPSKKGAP